MEAKGISVIFEELLRKRQKQEQYIHKTFVKHHLKVKYDGRHNVVYRNQYAC
jgi:hypothetical protein